LNDLVEGTLRALRHEASNRKIIAKVDLMPDLPIIMGDNAQLQEVVTNLVQNAIEAFA
jgi:signal transduction histidine kinase